MLILLIFYQHKSR